MRLYELVTCAVGTLAMTSCASPWPTKQRTDALQRQAVTDTTDPSLIDRLVQGNDEGRYTQVIARLKDHIAKYPDHPQMYMLTAELGMAYYDYVNEQMNDMMGKSDCDIAAMVEFDLQRAEKNLLKAETLAVSKQQAEPENNRVSSYICLIQSYLKKTRGLMGFMAPGGLTKKDCIF